MIQCWKLLFLLSCLTSYVKPTKDYYWREYNGVIPEDAFPGGADMGGNPTYIGQTFFPSKTILTPTIIERGQKNASINISNERISSYLDTKVGTYGFLKK